MRTTIRIDEALYRRAKSRAAETGHTVSDIIEDAVRQALTVAESSQPLAPLPTVHGRLQPGVDLNDSAALLEVMEGR
jgi:negative regulator of replication initiation